MDWLKCSICFNTYNDSVLRPRSLICGHTFCENCLNSTIQNKTLTCPQCRKILEIHSVTDLPINYIVEGLLKSLKPSSQDVTEGAISRPIEEEGVTDDKQEKYDSLKLILEQQQESLSSQKELLKTSAGMCNEHPGNELIFRCSSHKSWVCEKCIEKVGDHPKNNCSIISFKEEIEKRKQEHNISLENEEKSCDKIILEIQKHISCLNENREHHLSVLDALQVLVSIHKKEDENLENEIKSFEKIIENGNNIKQRLVEVKQAILNAETLDESNYARDMVANKKSVARNWAKESDKDIEEGKMKLQTSSKLEIATKRSLEYRVKLHEELDMTSSQSEKSVFLKRTSLFDNDATKEDELKLSRTAYDEVCVPHHKSIEHKCLKCKRWICVECLKIHTTLTGCTTINVSTALKHIKGEHIESIHWILSSFDKSTICFFSKIEELKDEIKQNEVKKKELSEQSEEYGREIKNLQKILDEGKQKTGNISKFVDHLDSTNSPYAVMDIIELLAELKQEFSIWSITNFNMTFPQDIHDISKALKNGMNAYVESVIKNQQKHGKLSFQDGNIYIHNFQEHAIEEGNTIVPFECLQKLLTDCPCLVFIELSLGVEVKGSIVIKLNKNLSNIRKNFVNIVTGSLGKSLVGISHNNKGYNAQWISQLPFEDLKVVPDHGSRKAKRGDIVGFYGNNYLQQLFFHIGDKEWRNDGCKVIGSIISGIEVLQECYDEKSIWSVITDCGLVLPISRTTEHF